MSTPILSILKSKPERLVYVSPTETVQAAVLVMNQHKIGCTIVLDDGALVGIFTERDILARVVASGLDPKSTLVRAVMTSPVRTVTPSTSVDEVMALMFEKNIRHIPVTENGKVVSLISIGDVNRWMVLLHKAEAEALRNYVTGGFPA
ncbi:MAG TPA: CBS domain-containing protein [Opitutaceae bacterium]|nr:CBS domain-containing protein [Opitutaceae bacterium]